MKLPIALQLWSIKEDVEKDFYGTLKKVAKMGYSGVEFAGYYGKSSQEVKKLLAELGLRVAGSHISKEQIIQQTDEVITFEKELGNKYIVCPYADFNSLEEWKEFAKDLQQAGKKLSEAGLKLLYHNHANEFVKFHNEYVLDILLNTGSSEFLQAELDTYWVEYAGVNAVHYMAKYHGRTPLIHLKDMSQSKKESTELGNGVLDIRGIVQQAEKNNVEWLVIEQEAFTKPPLESIEIGLNNLKELILSK